MTPSSPMKRKVGLVAPPRADSRLADVVGLVAPSRADSRLKNFLFEQIPNRLATERRALPSLPCINRLATERRALPIFSLIISLISATAAPAAPTPILHSPSSAIAASQPATQTMHSLDDKHKLAIGDRLSFRILEDQEDPAEPREPKSLIVADSGELEVPYIGRFSAEGKTSKQLARELKAALERDYYYQATVLIAVDLMAKTRGKVYLVGPVRVPGPQDIPSDETLTLSKAIMRAGGFSDYADKRNVKVTRKGATLADKKTLVVDVGEILEKGRVERDVVLEPDDLILIEEKSIRF